MTIAFGVLAMSFISCREYECSGQQQTFIVTSAAAGCLPSVEARGAFPERRVISEAKEIRPYREAVTVCWYRWPEKGLPCAKLQSRLDLRMGNAGAQLPRPADESLHAGTMVSSCDEAGDLYGTVDSGEADAPDGVECPEKLPIDRIAPAYRERPPTSFVGRDSFEGRIMCTYDSDLPSYCGSGGGGDTIGMLGG